MVGFGILYLYLKKCGRYRREASELPCGRSSAYLRARASFPHSSPHLSTSLHAGLSLLPPSGERFGSFWQRNGTVLGRFQRKRVKLRAFFMRNIFLQNGRHCRYRFGLSSGSASCAHKLAILNQGGALVQLTREPLLPQQRSRLSASESLRSSFACVPLVYVLPFRRFRTNVCFLPKVAVFGNARKPARRFAALPKKTEDGPRRSIRTATTGVSNPRRRTPSK